MAGITFRSGSGVNPKLSTIADERHFCSQPVLVYHSENSKCGSPGGHTGRSIEAGEHRDSAESPTDITFRLILDQNHQHLSTLTWPSLAYDSISLS